MEYARFFYVLGIVLSLILHVLDQATDVFAAFLFFLEGEIVPAIFTLAFVFLPGFFIFCHELKRICAGKSNVFKALGYLTLSPLWAIVIHLYSLFDHRYLESALYYKTLEGFVEASPQFALQLALLFRGTTPKSSQLVLEPLFNEDGESTVNVSALNIFGRIYQPDDQQWFGYVHISSVVMSFISIFVTAIMFNDIQPGRGPKGTIAKVCAGIPYYFSTILFRGVGVALLICFVRYWGGVVTFGLFFMNFLSALAIGDDFNRCCSYAIWSLLVPVGFNRDPSANLGYSKISLFDEHRMELSRDPVTDKDIERSSGRVKFFLTAHVLSSLIILGVPLVGTLILVQLQPEFYAPRCVFYLSILNTVFLPVLGLALAFSVVLGRPYHRLECSGGETPSGNWLV